MLPDQGIAGCAVDAVNLVAGDIALNPLDLAAEFRENAAGCPGDCLEFGRCEIAGSGNFSFDYISGHDYLPGIWWVALNRADGPTAPRSDQWSGPVFDLYRGVGAR